MEQEIKELFFKKATQKEIAEKLGIPVYKVQYIIDKNQWKYDKV